VRKAIAAPELQQEVTEIFWTLRKTDGERAGEILEIDLQVLESRPGFLQNGPGFCSQHHRKSQLSGADYLQ
jgi:hypothetical protein